ncbi:AAA family ATPase [Azospirillum canadense]|uniref:AAA family ATPase n=1 Tax=Azospirillum canadense TaxID=403962 RepID=UPI002227FDC6|nr:hypothetical protein [Azospirillum canadense]MCW2238709.1 pilus assembly protein CpaE [Azospirillum canadense]
MSRRINTLALLRTAACADELRSAFDKADAGRLDLRMADSLPSGAAGFDVLMAELPFDAAGAVKALGTLLRDTAQGRPVIAIVQEATIPLVRELMRTGALDVLPRPVAPSDLLNALSHARAQVAAGTRSEGRVITMMRSCGGIGATTLAVQTALSLVDQAPGPATGQKARVCLADFDLQTGNAALSLDLTGAAGLTQILDAPARLDAAFLASAMAHHPSGLEVLAAPSEIVPFDALTPDMAVRILALLRERYDVIVVDMPHAWTAWTSPVLAGSALVALLLRLDVTGLLRTQAQLKLMAEEQLDDVPRLLVAGQTESGSALKQRLKDAQAALGQPIDAGIRADPRGAQEARESGRPLAEAAPGSVIVKDVRAVTALALSTLYPAPQDAEAPRSALRRLLSLAPLGAAR